MSFWKKLRKPIIGLSPMDGVTDAAFRFIVDEIGKPAVIFTEFVPVEAIKANAQRVLDAFVTHNTDTPLVAQLYGTDLEAYYLSTLVVCELGFDGVDINMGCPAKSVQSRGAGAGLIKNPELARQIIKTVKKAAVDYANGAYKNYDVPSDIKDRTDKIKMKEKQRILPVSVSVKTRIGYEQNNAKSWISEIAQEKPDCITVHGRTYIHMESYVGVGVGVDVGVSVGVRVGVSVGVPVGVFVGVGVCVGVSVSVGVGVIPTPTSATLLIFSEFQKTCKTFELFVDAVGEK